MMIGKAKLKAEIKLVQVSEFSGREWDEDDAYVFEKGSEVEVLREVGGNDYGSPMFLIYSPDIKDATVVVGDILEFIKGEKTDGE